jgi:hypothetical protein
MAQQKKISEYAKAALRQAGPDEAHAEPVAGRVAGVAASLARKGWLARTDNGYAYLYWRTAEGEAALRGDRS